MQHMKLLSLLVGFLLFVTFASGQTENPKLLKTNNGTVKITSDAPLELINAKSTELRGIIDPVKNTFAFQLDIQSLKGFNSALQEEHFYENYMETDKYDKATFSGKIIEKIDFESNGSYNIRAKGNLELHGIKQERIIKCIIKVEEGIVKASSEFFVGLADHNITIPKLVYQKIAEEIFVEINTELSRSEPE